MAGSVSSKGIFVHILTTFPILCIMSPTLKHSVNKCTFTLLVVLNQIITHAGNIFKKLLIVCFIKIILRFCVRSAAPEPRTVASLCRSEGLLTLKGLGIGDWMIYV